MDARPQFFAHDRRMLAWVPLGVVILFALRGLGDFVQTYFMSVVGRGVVKNLRSQVFDRFVRLPVAYFDRTPAGAMLSRLTYNTEQVAQAATDSIISSLRESLIIIGSLVYLFSANAYLTTVALTVVPLIAVLIRAVNRHFRRYGERMQGSMGDVTSIAKEAIEAPRVIGWTTTTHRHCEGNRLERTHPDSGRGHRRARLGDRASGAKWHRGAHERAHHAGDCSQADDG